MANIAILGEPTQAAAPVQPSLRPAFFLKDGAVLQRGEPIPIWGTCEDHATVEVSLGGQILVTETDSSGWWMVVFPAMQESAEPLTLVMKSDSEKVVVKSLTLGDVWQTSSHEPLLRAAPPFQDHAVLQRDKPIPVWGTCAPGVEVTVQLADEVLKGKADEKGKWKVTFPARPASAQPITLSLEAAGKKIVVSDLLVGDVWLLGGQSNMEWVFRRLPEAKTFGDKANFPTLRYLTGPDLEAGTPQSQRPTEWLVCSPETVGDFSSAGLYFAVALQEKLGIPIGLVDVNWGGTKIEPWICPTAFSTEPELAELAQFVSSSHPDFPQGKTAQKEWLKSMAQWSSNAEAALEKGRTPAAPPSEPGVTSDLQRKQNPSRIYNAMVAPLVPFGVRGMVWYQGENNGGDLLYLPKMRALLAGWRKAWGEDWPCYFVQLANFNFGKPPEDPPFADHPWAVVREAQRRALSIPKTGMAVTIDLGDNSKNPHYKNKRDVGYRLAQWALHDEYGEKDVVPSGPLFERAEREGDKIRVHFKYAEGLMTGKKTGAEPVVADSGKVRWVALKGSDEKWVEADAVIENGTLLVSHPSVPHPLEIAYAYAGFPTEANLYNGAGLPASPFRQDLSGLGQKGAP